MRMTEDLREVETLVIKEGAAKTSSTNIFSTVSTPAKASSTNPVNTVSIPVSTASPNEGIRFHDQTNPEEDNSMRKKPIGTKWVYRNKKDEIGVVVRNKARIEAIDLFGHLPQYMGFIIPNISESIQVVKASYGYIKTPEHVASTPIETQKPLVKDEEASDVDVSVGHIVSFLGELHSWQYIKQTIMDTSNTDETDIQDIAIRHHFIKDAYEKKLIQVLKIQTDDNVANLLTKAFDVSRFQFLVVTIRMINSIRCIGKGRAIIVLLLFVSRKCYLCVLPFKRKGSTVQCKVKVMLGKVCIRIEVVEVRHINAQSRWAFYVWYSMRINRSDLLFDNADGIDLLPNQAILDAYCLWGKVTPLFASMLVQPTQDEGAHSDRPSEAQPTPSPTPPSEVPNEPHTDSSPAQTSEVEGEDKGLQWMKTRRCGIILSTEDILRKCKKSRTEKKKETGIVKKKYNEALIGYFDDIKEGFERIELLAEKLQEQKEEQIYNRRKSKLVDFLNGEVIKEEDKEEVKEENKGEESIRKRKLGTRKKMKSRKKRYIQNTSDDNSEKENDELRLHLTVAPDEKKELHGSSGVHSLCDETGFVIHMHGRDEYPLKKEVWCKCFKVEVLVMNETVTMALVLIRFSRSYLQS
ncbi:hypothetical protein Tco_1509447 [Tanacetum coccineum]